MRSTTLFALIALLCLIAITFAEPEAAAAVPKATAPPTIDTTQFKALQDKIEKLDRELATLRSAVEKDNKDVLVKLQDAQAKAKAAEQAAQQAAQQAANQKPAAPVKDPKVSELDQVVTQLRTKVEELSIEMSKLPITAQMKQMLQVVLHFYTEKIAPKVEQGIQIATQYAIKAKAAAVPLFGQTQGVLSRIYHAGHALLKQYKPQVVKHITPIVSQIKQIPADRRPLVVDVIFTTILFFALFIVFLISYLIWATFWSLVCCCSSQKKKQSNQLEKN